MIKITPRFLSKIINGANKKGKDTTKLEVAYSKMFMSNSSIWTSRKCNSFDEVERIFDDLENVRPWMK
jgi:hypothetical protein